MSVLVNAQIEFAEDIASLIKFAQRNGLGLTFGEAWRPPELQQIYIEQGKSWTRDSRHLSRLAVDFNLFQDGRWVKDEGEFLLLGQFWESLRPGKNKWGVGDALPKRKDANHFERKVL